MPELSLGTLGPVPFVLHDLTGELEEAIDTSEPDRSAFRLASALVHLPEGQSLDALPVALLHRLYLAIYRAVYAGPVQNTSRCGACAQEFEFDLNLETITARQDALAAAGAAPQDDWWQLPDGGQVRPPCYRDLSEGNLADLLARICRGPVTENAASTLLEQVAPLLDFDVETACPHCDTLQQLRFSMPRYLVRKFAAERTFLLREVHLLASHYHWSHGEIMALRRRDRRELASLVQAERHQRRGLQAVA